MTCKTQVLLSIISIYVLSNILIAQYQKITQDNNTLLLFLAPCYCKLKKSVNRLLFWNRKGKKNNAVIKLIYLYKTVHNIGHNELMESLHDKMNAM